MREFLENGDKATDCSSAWKASAGAEAKELRSQYDCGKKKRILGLFTSHTTNDFNSPDFLVYVHPFKQASSLRMCPTPKDQGSALQRRGSFIPNLDLDTEAAAPFVNSFPNPGLFSSLHK